MAGDARTADERRVRHWSLVAIVLLAPAAFAAGSWRAVRDLAHSRDVFWSKPDASGEVAYAGARFRASGFRIFADSPDPKLAVPPDRALVLVRLKAKLGRDAGEDWVVCRLELADGKGREWRPASIYFPLSVIKLVEPDGKSPPTCGSVSLSRPKAGEEIEFGANYVVPRDALPTLEARFSISPERPWAIAFPKP